MQILNFFDTSPPLSLGGLLLVLLLQDTLQQYPSFPDKTSSVLECVDAWPAIQDCLAESETHYAMHGECWTYEHSWNLCMRSCICKHVDDIHPHSSGFDQWHRFYLETFWEQCVLNSSVGEFRPLQCQIDTSTTVAHDKQHPLYTAMFANGHSFNKTSLGVVETSAPFAGDSTSPMPSLSCEVSTCPCESVCACVHVCVLGSTKATMVSDITIVATV